MSDDLLARIEKRDCDALAEFIESRRFQLMAFIERQLGTALRRKVEPDQSRAVEHHLPEPGVPERAGVAKQAFAPAQQEEEPEGQEDPRR
jgi:hypothetical protein